MGGGVTVAYGGDWSEYHSTNGWYNLDPLWSDSNIDFMAIDCYVPLTPDLPTVAEAAKLPNYEVGTWFGLVAPAKLPDAVMRKLGADVAEILAMPDVKTKLEGMGMEHAPQKGPDFDAFVNREFTKWAAVIKKAGMEPQ